MNLKNIFNIIKRKNNKNRFNNILVVGPDSMLGYDLIHILRQQEESSENHINYVCADHSRFNILDMNQMESFLLGCWMKFDFVVNCSAYTNTTKSEYECKKESFDVNFVGCLNLARLCRKHSMKLIHISTDYVISEESGDDENGDKIPYPVNNYGVHKLLGELAIKSEMYEGTYAILRTSWLYGSHKRKSFVHKVISNMFRAFESGNMENIKGTMDEMSIPTSTRELSVMIINCINHNLTGTLPATGNDKNGTGVIKHDFVVEIIDKFFKYRTSKNELLPDSPPFVHGFFQNGPIRYPKNSILKPNSCVEKSTMNKLKENLENTTWKDELDKFIKENIKDLEHYEH